MKKYILLAGVNGAGKSTLYDWDKPKSVHELINVRPEMMPFVQDYKANIFEIAFLPDDVVELFQSDFRFVAEIFTQDRKLREGVINNVSYTGKDLDHAKEVMELMTVMTGDRRFEEAYNKQTKGGTSGMFATFDIYEKRGEQQGVKKERKRANLRNDKVEAVCVSIKADPSLGAEEKMDMMMKVIKDDRCLDELCEKYNIML